MPTRDDALSGLVPAEFQGKTVMAGSSLSTPPMNFTEATSGEATGYFVDLTNAAAAKLGLTVRWIEQPYTGLLPAMQGKKIQLYSPASSSPDVLQAVDIATVTKRSSALLVERGRGDALESVADACGLDIGYTTGSVFDQRVAEKIVADCNAKGAVTTPPRTYPSAAAVQTAVRSGQIDAMVEPDTVAVYEAMRGDVYDAALVGEFDAENQGIGFLAAGGPELGRAFVAAFASLIEDGTYEDILADYGLEDIAKIEGEPELLQQ